MEYDIDSVMEYEIVPIKRNYRGVARTSFTIEFLTRRTKKIYDKLMDIYYDYESVVQEAPSKSGFLKVIDFYDVFKANRIKCEVIVYDVSPLKSLWDYDLDFLGIDIVNEMSQSLLYECVNKDIKQYLNENGLCKSKDDASVIVSLINYCNVKWDYYYVYKVNC